MNTQQILATWSKALKMTTRIAGFGFSLSAALTLAVSPATAAITNTATASGSYNATPVTSSGSGASVDVAPAAPALTVDKTTGAITTAFGSSASITDANDTITYSYVITNTGNVTITGAVPTDTGPLFNGVAGTGSWAAGFSPASATISPGNSQTFTRTWTLSAADVANAAGITGGVTNTASASGTGPGSTTPTVTGDTTSGTIPAGPHLSMVKTAVLTDGSTGTAGKADVGETIVYTYTITNDGNVPLTGVAVSDTHEGTPLASSVFTNEALVTDGPLSATRPSADASLSGPNPKDGIWDTLEPGATITIEYIHTVTQAEVDAG